MLFVEIASRTVISLLFAISAIGKLRSQRAFLAFLSELRGLMPAGVTRVVAPVVCLLEAAVVVLVVASRTVMVGMVLAAVLLVAFSVAIVLGSRNGTQARCHCFGFRGARLGRRHVFRNVGLLGICAAWMVAAHLLPSHSHPGVAVPAAAAAAATVIVAAVVFMDEIAFLLSIGPSQR